MSKKPFNLSVYFIADPSLCLGRPVTTVTAAALEGGATLIQYRDKNSAPDTLKQNASDMLDVCRAYGAPLLINDHVELAAEIGTDGAHIGQGDLNPAEARRILGPDAILGLTAFTPEHFAEIQNRLKQDSSASHIDYTGTGPVYPTKTDKGKPVMGVSGLTQIIKQSPVPVVGIGGITPENAAPVIQAGASGVAMMRAISEAERPDLAAAQFAKIIKETHHAAA